MIDSYGRQINYLRLSVTDRCNLRCRYCMPAQGNSLISREEILSYEELSRALKVAVGCGINKLRLTGGEPLVRRGIIDLVRMLAKTEGLDDLGLTTNAIKLVELAPDLYKAGLRRINISLDTLSADKYRWITRYAGLSKVWSGIHEALKIGFHSVKLNVVVIRGFNDDELPAFARLAFKYPIEIRFIEFMPFHKNHLWSYKHYISSKEMREKLTVHEKLIPQHKVKRTEIAESYELAGGAGTVSFISPLSSSFCSSCNRLRLTADGYVGNCLFSNQKLDIKTSLRRGVSDEELAKIFYKAVTRKPQGHGLSLKSIQYTGRAMHAIGG